MKNRILRIMISALLMCIALIEPLAPIAFGDERDIEQSNAIQMPLQQQGEQIERFEHTTSGQTDTLRTADDLERQISRDPFAFMVDEVRVVLEGNSELEDEPGNNRQRSPRPEVIIPGLPGLLRPDENAALERETAVPVDRYIVKYADDGRDAVLSSLDGRLKSIEEITLNTNDRLSNGIALQNDTWREANINRSQ